MAAGPFSLTSPNITVLPECAQQVFSWVDNNNNVTSFELDFFTQENTFSYHITLDNTTNFTTALSMPAGTFVLGALSDEDDILANFSFAIIEAGGNKDCLLSRAEINVSDPEDIVTFDDDADDSVGFNLTANGLTKEGDLRIGSCDQMEVSALSGKQPLTLSLFPQFAGPLPVLGFAINGTKATFPAPYPEGTSFIVRIDDARGFSQESDAVLTLPSNDTSCVLTGSSSSNAKASTSSTLVIVSSTSSPSQTISGGTIAGVVLLILSLVIAALLVAFYFLRQRRSRSKPQILFPSSPSPTVDHSFPITISDAEMMHIEPFRQSVSITTTKKDEAFMESAASSSEDGYGANEQMRYHRDGGPVPTNIVDVPPSYTDLTGAEPDVKSAETDTVTGPMGAGSRARLFASNYV